MAGHHLFCFSCSSVNRCLLFTAREDGSEMIAGGSFRLRPRIFARSPISAAVFVAVTGSPLWPVLS
jgi:hypothetical protein